MSSEQLHVVCCIRVFNPNPKQLHCDEELPLWQIWREMFCEVVQSEGRAIVRHVGFRNNAIVTADFLKGGLGSQGIMGG